MALPSLRIAVSARPPVAKYARCSQRGGIRVAGNARQVSKFEPQKLEINISRRDAMIGTSTALMWTFLTARPAEAHSAKPETRRKIREKLDKLREKAGVPKEKTGPKSDDKEKMLLIPPNKMTVPLVEATV